MAYKRSGELKACKGDSRGGLDLLVPLDIRHHLLQHDRHQVQHREAAREHTQHTFLERIGTREAQEQMWITSTHTHSDVDRWPDGCNTQAERERESEPGQLEGIKRIGTRDASEQNEESGGVHNCR